MQTRAADAPLSTIALMNSSPNQRAERSDNGQRRDRSWPPSPERLPAPVTDNHAHLDFVDGDEQLSVEQQILAARAVGVTGVITIGCDLDAARWTHRLISGDVEQPAEADLFAKHLRAGLSIHPNTAVEHRRGEDRHGNPLPPLEDAIAEIADLLDHPQVVTIGETGLDWFRTSRKKDADRAAQVDSFRAHIALAKEKQLPMQIHDREAHQDVLTVLDQDGIPDRTVLHCFSGDAEFAEACVDRGAYLSFAGPVTFTANDSLREALAATPLNRVMVETDAPFLTPMPYRGRPNSSYLIPHTMQVIAEVKGISLEEACSAVQTTTREVYGWTAA